VLAEHFAGTEQPEALSVLVSVAVWISTSYESSAIRHNSTTSPQARR
jgi:hypothetical protein